MFFGNKKEAFLEAARTDDLVRVKELVPHFVNDRELMQKAFGASVATGSMMVLRFFVEEQGVDVKDMTSQAVLRLSYTMGRKDVTLYLLEQGAEAGPECEIILKQVIKSGDVKLMQAMAANKSLLDGLFRKSVHGQDAALVAQLLVLGADVTQQDNRALFEAVSSGNADMVMCLLEGGGNPNARGGEILRRSLHDDVPVSVLGALLEKGGKADMQESALLIRACELDQPAKALVLIGEGAEPNAQKGKALRMALKSGSLPVLSLLLKHGGNANIAKGGLLYDENITLHQARYLIDNGYDVKRYGGPFLVSAAKEGNPQIVRMLLKSGLNPNASYTAEAARTAILNDKPRILYALAEFGALPGGYQDGLLLELAVKHINYKHNITGLLLRNGADPDSSGARRALMSAIKEQWYEDLHLLVDQGVRVSRHGWDVYKALLDVPDNARALQICLEAGEDPNFENGLPLKYMAQRHGDSASYTNELALVLAYGGDPLIDGKAPLKMAEGRGNKELLTLFYAHLLSNKLVDRKDFRKRRQSLAEFRDALFGMGAPGDVPPDDKDEDSSPRP